MTMLPPSDVLFRRRSVPTRLLGAPGPSANELELLFAAAIRVPDHTALAPWRLITLQGEAKLRFGERVAAMAIEKNPALSEDKRAKDRLRYTYAPIVVAVVARLQDNPKVPQQEQLLSAGCVAYNLLLGAQALGYGAQWITGWAAYDRDVAALLGLAVDERVVGFVHVGTPQGEVPERRRPALAEIVSAWNG